MRNLNRRQSITCFRTPAALWLGFMLLVNSVAINAAEYKQRVSFAVSGGASKGAYEAGLNWAILHVLRYEEKQPYQEKVLKGRFRPFEAASMAGASAGGINAILSAMDWCVRPESEGGFPSRIDDNVFRNLWLKPDINTLLPPTARSPIYRSDDAVLARKNLIEAAEVLRSLWNSPVFRKNCRIPLGVTVTRVVPEQLSIGGINVKNQRYTFPFEFRTEDDTTAGFYFDPGDYPFLLDYSMILLPNERGSTNYEISDKRVEEAIMTSAAFPVAFGRKRLQYCRIKASYESDENQTEVKETPRSNALTCPDSYELSEAEFADGGLFDNLPIGLARVLAEENKRSQKNPLPVTYIYLDPDRLRYQVPDKRKFEACFSDNPPEACQELDYSFRSESSLLFDALGTAQRYELYRELTSNTWSYNLSQLAFQTADLFEEIKGELSCGEELPFFTEAPPCHSALQFAGRLLEISYDRVDAPITPPFSVEKLQKAGLVARCRKAEPDLDVPIEAECYIDFMKFRKELVQRLQSILQLVPGHNEILLQRVHNAQFTIYSDRIIRVTSRGAPITGELLGSFAAFLDLKFREYDYYVGIYDAVVAISNVICSRHYSPRSQPQEYHNCRDAVAKRLHTQLGIPEDKQANYIFALLAKWEFYSQNALQFAYDPMPADNRDMRLIYEGLLNTYAAQWSRLVSITETDTGEVRFFAYLQAQGFNPTAAEDGARPLLADIMEDPELWSHELARRFTNRLMVLENEAQRIYTDREPDAGKRPKSNQALMGGASFVLRSSTYKYPKFDFAPTTASKDWKWRYVIPYEMTLDLVAGGLILAWQPTWALSKNDLLGVRGSVAFTKGIVGEGSYKAQDNYFSLGFSYSRLSGGNVLSSYGVTPGYYRTFKTPQSGNAGSFGGEIHLGMLQNKLRFALGTRDFERNGDRWYLLFGVTDIPGIIYWFTR
jgi:predicted acylesterase/phospholipase RssA